MKKYTYEAETRKEWGDEYEKFTIVVKAKDRLSADKKALDFYKDFTNGEWEGGATYNLVKIEDL